MPTEMDKKVPSCDKSFADEMRSLMERRHLNENVPKEVAQRVYEAAEALYDLKQKTGGSLLSFDSDYAKMAAIANQAFADTIIPEKYDDDF